MRFHHCLLTAAAFAGLLAGVAASSAQAAPSGRFAANLPRPRPFVSWRNRLPLVASGQQYTIADVGHPNPKTYPGGGYGTGPQGFNDTGQIFGAEFRAGAQHSDCLIYTDGAFVDPSTAANGCSLYSIDDATSAGAFEAVGDIQELFDPDGAAIVVNGSATSRSLGVVQFEAADPFSQLIGVNANGIAFGETYDHFVPSQNASGTYVPTTKHFGPVQPACVAPGASQNGCLQYVGGNGPNYLCPSGGCYVTTTYLLGGTTASSSFELYPLAGGTPTYIPSGFTSGSTSYSINPPLDLSNYGLAAAAFATQGGPYVAIYPASANKWQLVPALADGCAAHYFISMNDAGEILGVDSCSASTYWTWDPTNGIQAVSIPSNSYAGVQLLGVNDNGQLLAALATSSGFVDWGTLNPVGGRSARYRGHAVPPNARRVRP